MPRNRILRVCGEVTLEAMLTAAPVQTPERYFWLLFKLFFLFILLIFIISTSFDPFKDFAAVYSSTGF